MTRQKIGVCRIPERRPRNCRPHNPTLTEIDSCRSGPISTERIRQLLGQVYERLLPDEKGSAIRGEVRRDLMAALENCYLEDGYPDEDEHQQRHRLTLKERLTRLCIACWNRLDELDERPITLSYDLGLFDALQDVIHGRTRFDWSIDRHGRVQFT